MSRDKCLLVLIQQLVDVSAEVSAFLLALPQGGFVVTGLMLHIWN
jgi:hypothetical protein